eukprot:8194230-Ditylum_brightwellii.AAC.1
MAFTSESLIGMIYASMSTTYPGGLAYKVVVALHEKYAPKDLVSKVELHRQLNMITMKRDDDPTVLFEQISGLRNRHNTASFQI